MTVIGLHKLLAP